MAHTLRHKNAMLSIGKGLGTLLICRCEESEVDNTVGHVMKVMRPADHRPAHELGGPPF